MVKTVMNRRGFAKLLLGGAISIAATPLLKVAVLADRLSASTRKHVLSSFGWMEKDKITWTEIVTRTIQERAPIVRDNVIKHNALLSIANEWQQDDIDRISAKLTDRMNKKKYFIRKEGETRL